MTDTFENTSVSYASRVIQANAAALASLALAPKAPVTSETITSGPRKGQLTPMLSRGKSRYDAALRWKNENPEPDLLGYVIVMRKSTAPYWEKEVFVGKVNEYTFKDVSIDDSILASKRWTGTETRAWWRLTCPGRGKLWRLEPISLSLTCAAGGPPRAPERIRACAS